MDNSLRDALIYIKYLKNLKEFLSDKKLNCSILK